MPVEAQSLARRVAGKHPDLAAVCRLAKALDPDATLLGEAHREVRAAYLETVKAADQQLQRREKSQRAVDDATAAVDACRRLRDAARRVDQFLLAGPSDARVRELRQSLWRDNLDRALADSTGTVATQRRGKLDVAFAGELRVVVRDLVAKAGQAWITQATEEARQELRLLIRRAWSPLEGELPVGAPSLPDIPLPWEASSSRAWWDSKEPPELSRQVDIPGFWGQLGRQFRGMLFSAMMVGAMGLGALGLAEDRGLIALGIAPALALVAYLLVSREQSRRRERALRDADKAIRDELTRWVEGRLDRVGAHLRDHLRGHMTFTLRPAWLDFYRDEVGPRLHRAEGQLRDAKDQHSRLARGAATAGGDRDLQRLEAMLRPS